MSYDKLTKAELISTLETLEKDYLTVLEQVEVFKAQSVTGYVETFKKEAVLLGQDLVKLARFVYNSGFAAKEALTTTWSTFSN